MQDDHAGKNGAAKPFDPPPRFIPPGTDELRRQLAMTDEERRAYIELWEETCRKLDEITDETDDDEEAWDEFSRSLGMDPKTGRGLAP